MIRLFTVLAYLMAAASASFGAAGQSRLQNSGFLIGHVNTEGDVYGAFPATGVLVRVTAVTSATVFRIELLREVGGGVGSYDLDSLFVAGYRLRGLRCATLANEGVWHIFTNFAVSSGQVTTTTWGTALAVGDILVLEPRGASSSVDVYIRVDTGVIVSDNLNDGWDSTMFHPIIDITGLCQVKILVECTVDLTGVSATIALGAPGATSTMIATTAAPLLDVGVWFDTGGELGVLMTPASCIRDFVTPGDDIGLTVAGADLTGGRLIFHCWVTPLAAGAGGIADNGQ